MALIDTHTHLESFARNGTLAATLERASAAELEAMIAIGTSSDDWTLYRDLAKSHAGWVHYSAGLHPCSVDVNWTRELEELEKFWGSAGSTGRLDVPVGPDLGQAVRTGGEQARALHHSQAARPSPLALGEIGLDRFHLPKDVAEAEKIFAWQRAAFAEGLSLAKRVGCPVVVHSRGAFRECVEMIDASGVDWAKVVFHCFTEGPAEMSELVRRGGFGSFTGILTYKNADAIRAAAKAQGLARLMIETDAPYLTPAPHRGKPNEPAFLRHTAEFAATEVFGASVDELAAITTANARRFFGI